jgi:hypothetical protein
MLLLAGLVIAFSHTESAKWLAGYGLKFTHAEKVLQIGKKEAKKTVPKKIQPKIDSVVLKKLTIKDKRSIDSLHRKIEFLNNTSVDGKTPLDAFFASLETTADSLVHIWYYGDSQIEGDRITQDLRSMLQKYFGGSGQGLVLFNDVASYRYLKTDCRGFNKYNVFNHRKTKGFGFNGIKYRILPGDTIAAQTSIKILPGLKFSKVYLLHDKNEKSMVRVIADKKSEKEIVLTGYKTLIHDGWCKELKLKYSNNGTTYFGYLLEGQKGIQIDNCGIRGHSGDGLFNIDNGMLQKQASLLGTKLIVFHYGNNAIPYLRSDAHAAQVGNEFYKLFVKFKKAMPQASILVVSGGDMGRIVDENPEPYPFAASLAAEMEKAAVKAGCAFFDMYAIMQSNEGITGWIKQGKASIDGHLSAYGQQFFARSLYREMMNAYQIYHLSHTRSH